MDLSIMRSAVRRDLHDEDSQNYRWTDDELDRHIRLAIKEFSYRLPNELMADIATTPGSRDIDISSLANRVMVEGVEYPAGLYPPAYQRFASWGDTLTLLTDVIPDGSDARVYYGVIHTVDGSGSTIPAPLERLVAAGACGFALVQWANYAVNRVNVGGAPAPAEYRRQGNERLASFRAELRKLGRHNRVRVRQLYTPATTPVSKSVVVGP
ncbi:MAG: hypothetical protein IBX68_12745 [Dehalococcoidia bacterium]|nr:hypothetical protein [Dehalococcoidia bacterium]